MSLMNLFCLYFVHIASAYSVLKGCDPFLRNSFVTRNVVRNFHAGRVAKHNNTVNVGNSNFRLNSIENESSNAQRLLPRRNAMLSVAALLSIASFSVFVRYPNSACAAIEEKKNTYPGGNQLKSLKSMGGLPKKIRSLCRVMVSSTIVQYLCLFLLSAQNFRNCTKTCVFFVGKYFPSRMKMHIAP